MERLVNEAAFYALNETLSWAHSRTCWYDWSWAWLSYFLYDYIAQGNAQKQVLYHSGLSVYCP